MNGPSPRAILSVERLCKSFKDLRAVDGGRAGDDVEIVPAVEHRVGLGVLQSGVGLALTGGSDKQASFEPSTNRLDHPLGPAGRDPPWRQSGLLGQHRLCVLAQRRAGPAHRAWGFAELWEDALHLHLAEL